MKLKPLSPKQKQAWGLATTRANAWEGSVRSGKTVSSLHAWVEFVMSAPPGNLAMIGKTERTLKRNIVDTLVDWLGRKHARHVIGSGELHLCGRRIYLYGANNEEAKERIQGITLVGAYIDEVVTIPESFYTMVLSRLSEDNARLFMTMNPDAPRHWMKTKFLDKARFHLRADGEFSENPDPGALDLTRFSFRLADNETLDPAYVAAITAEYTGMWYERYIEGKWVAAEGAIFTSLDVGKRSRQLVDVLPRDLEAYTLAIDYGTTNPFAALIIAVSPSQERIYICREWYFDSKKEHKKMTDAEYSKALADWVRGGANGLCVDNNGKPYAVPIRAVVCDPSAASFRLQMKRDGWGWAREADNAVKDGIREVSSLITADRVRFHKSCTNTLREHSGYVWDPKATEKGEDSPLKVDDHTPDASRYGIRDLRRYWRHWLKLAPEEETEDAA